MSHFSVVRLKKLRDNIVVQDKWVENMYNAKTKKYGCPPTRQKVIFYSPNENEIPDFSLTVQDNFDATVVACYQGYILKTFGKFSSSSYDEIKNWKQKFEF